MQKIYILPEKEEDILMLLLKGASLLILIFRVCAEKYLLKNTYFFMKKVTSGKFSE